MPSYPSIAARSAVTALLATLLFCVAPSRLLAAPLERVSDFGSNPGNLEMFVFVPPDMPRAAPLVVVAHGCLQGAIDIAEMSGWMDLASAHRFALVLPQTSKANDSFAGCFRTWLPEHQERGKGEPLSVVQMVQWMIDHHSVDPKRVFMTGMSSGGQLTNAMLATYPDLFAAGAPQSAFPYKCATSFQDVGPCCLAQKQLTREEWGALARSGYPGYSGVRPRVSIWHGSADPLLVVMNLTDQMEQWTAALGVDDSPDAIADAQSARRIIYQDATRRPRVETVTIAGMGHAVAYDSTAQPVKCGDARPYAQDVHVCASAWIARWFGIVP